MRDQRERIYNIESTMKNEFEYALEVNLISQEQHDNYLQELKALTDYIYEKYKDDLCFYDEDWLKIHAYYESVIALDFVRERTKNNLEYTWLIEM